MSTTVSVVTVCYNADKTISNTIKSVLEQNYSDYEYIIVDGASKDNTLNIVEGFRSGFEDKGISFKVVSEKDNGIYDAMNKGAKLCSGEWILFLNADDSFADPDVLKDLFTGKDYEGYDIVYGDSYRVKGDTRKLDLADRDISILTDYKFFCHQATFTRKKVFDDISFDTQFKIGADYDFFLQAYLKKYTFHYENRVVCVYSVEGTSNKDYYKTIVDSYNVKVKNGLKRKSWTNNVKAYIWYLKHKFRKEW